MNKDIRKSTILISALLLVASAPSLIHDGTIRLITAVAVFPCITAAVRLLAGKIFVSRNPGKTEEMNQEIAQKADLTPVTDLLSRNAQTIPVLTSQLDSVIQDTETAVLDIGERFMGIVSRARSQASRAANAIAVVADEVRKLSARSTSAASEIGKLVRNVESDIAGICEETEKSAEKTEQRSKESEKIMDDTLDRLNDVLTKVQGELDGLSAETESLARDISGIVISMQFQDMTRQRIEHVIEPLHAIKTECEEMALNLLNPAAATGNKGSKDDMSWLEEMYTMESERQVMKETLSHNDETAKLTVF